MKRGWLTPVLRGVYLVGGAPFDQAAFRWAAVLLAGERAALVGESAAEERALLPGRAGVATVGRPTKGRKKAFRTKVRLESGGFGLVWVRQAAALDRDVEVIGLAPPSTSLGRTFVDLAGVDTWKFAQAWREADFRSLIDSVRVRDALRQGLDGSAHVSAKLADHVETDPGLHGYDSPAELDAVRAVLAAGMEHPEVNRWLKVPGGRRRVDLYFALARLAIEIDGWPGHRTRDAFEDDHVRDLDMLELDILTMRFTARHIIRDPADCARRILEQLERRTPCEPALCAPA